jgi:Glucose-repressible protein Grg1
MVITLRQSVRASPTSYYPTSARSSGHWRTTTNPKTLLAWGGGEMCQASLLSALLVYVIATAPPHSLHCVPRDCLHQTLLNYKLLPFCNFFSVFPFSYNHIQLCLFQLPSKVPIKLNPPTSIYHPPHHPQWISSRIKSTRSARPSRGRVLRLARSKTRVSSLSTCSSWYSLLTVTPEVAKGNTNAGIGTQATAAKDYLVDKKDQKAHEV